MANEECTVRFRFQAAPSRPLARVPAFRFRSSSLSDFQTFRISALQPFSLSILRLSPRPSHEPTFFFRPFLPVV
jgi:hypothetical protein